MGISPSITSRSTATAEHEHDIPLRLHIRARNRNRFFPHIKNNETTYGSYPNKRVLRLDYCMGYGKRIPKAAFMFYLLLFDLSISAIREIRGLFEQRHPLGVGKFPGRNSIKVNSAGGLMAVLGHRIISCFLYLIDQSRHLLAQNIIYLQGGVDGISTIPDPVLVSGRGRYLISDICGRIVGIGIVLGQGEFSRQPAQYDYGRFCRGANFLGDIVSRRHEDMLPLKSLLRLGRHKAYLDTLTGNQLGILLIDRQQAVRNHAGHGMDCRFQGAFLLPNRTWYRFRQTDIIHLVLGQPVQPDDDILS